MAAIPTPPHPRRRRCRLVLLLAASAATGAAAATIHRHPSTAAFHGPIRVPSLRPSSPSSPSRLLPPVALDTNRWRAAAPAAIPAHAAVAAGLASVHRNNHYQQQQQQQQRTAPLVGGGSSSGRPSKTRLQFAIQPAAFKTSINAVLRLVSACGLGLLAAFRGLLDQGSLSTLSRLIFAFFQPALLFTNVAMTLANPAGNQASLVVLPAFAVLQILVGSLYGRGLAKLLRLDPESDEGKELAVCSAFANSGPLPLLFADAFFRTHPTDPTLYPRAVAYISFYLVAWSPLFWTYGATILGAVKGQKPYYPPPKPPAPNATEPQQHMDPFAAAEKMATGVIARAKEVARHPTFQKIVSPPTMGCLLGALVGATPALRNLFIGASAPLACLFDALRTMGSAYLPTVLLVLAGSLAQGLKQLDASILGRTLAIMASRFALMPATAFLLLRLGHRAGLIPRGDPLLAFILLLQACMPCAQNTVVILQLQKRPEAAASMAKLVSLIYILAIVPMGLLLSAVLQYVRL